MRWRDTWWAGLEDDGQQTWSERNLGAWNPNWKILRTWRMVGGEEGALTHPEFLAMAKAHSKEGDVFKEIGARRRPFLES